MLTIYICPIHRVNEIEKAALSETTCPNPDCLKDIPREESAVPKESGKTDTPPMFESSPLEIQKDTQREKDTENLSQLICGKQPRKSNKRVSTSSGKRTRYNSGHHETIQAHESETRRSIEEIRRNRAADRERHRSSQMRSSALPDDCCFPSKAGNKKVSDVSQIFPEKLSRGIGKGDREPDEQTKRTNPCDSHQRQPQSEQPRCVPYQPPEDNQKEKCFPPTSTPAQVQKKTYDSPQAIPEKLPRSKSNKKKTYTYYVNHNPSTQFS
ncbi:unnamed protein product [Parnassius mnemosyne]|uniref:Uncharacterized protein n=1 Tax=Parnassius mnemosyne TaxID=213953 RepID=A0AAV1LGU1_9NEOP